MDKRREWARRALSVKDAQELVALQAGLLQPAAEKAAAGNAAASPFGCAYPGAGATVGPALVFGWLAGQHAAALG